MHGFWISRHIVEKPVRRALNPEMWLAVLKDFMFSFKDDISRLACQLLCEDFRAFTPLDIGSQNITNPLTLTKNHHALKIRGKRDVRQLGKRQNQSSVPSQ
jgi:hypothetical protein